MNYSDAIQNFLVFLRTERAKQILTVFFALLFMYALWQMVSIFWSSSAVNIATIKRSFKVTVAKLPDIAAWHLFGDYQTTEAALLPKTRLQLKLEGVLFSSLEKHSQAIISAPGQQAKLYFIGETVPGGAVIYRILHNSVILRNQGKLEVLPIERPKLKFGPKPEDIFQKN